MGRSVQISGRVEVVDIAGKSWMTAVGVLFVELVYEGVVRLQRDGC